jgi:hypothetical protein
MTSICLAAFCRPVVGFAAQSRLDRDGRIRTVHRVIHGRNGGASADVCPSSREDRFDDGRPGDQSPNGPRVVRGLRFST